MAAEKNSVEAFAALGRVLKGVIDQERAIKDNFVSSRQFHYSQKSLNNRCFSADLLGEPSHSKNLYKKGEQLVVMFPGVTGLMLLRYTRLDDCQHSFLRLELVLPFFSEMHYFLKGCKPEPRIIC